MIFLRWPTEGHQQFAGEPLERHQRRIKRVSKKPALNSYFDLYRENRLDAPLSDHFTRSVNLIVDSVRRKDTHGALRLLGNLQQTLNTAGQVIDRSVENQHR